ncbi:Fur family transcriptional regulator [Aureimonas phyllosphaerae]|uniref:Fur family zinc uptake transcriptional regulator n=1 Tax=Aureimonas phyllosphaerae TaxID=1166078 RepID=A0A7W6FUS2_9HYPH|nr:Fur family transcriptional regulator [Aureimonas phyllosphaerae]MBB3936045.1 Fur family zinc uptake transcriptional regulator [Aureimonas phyllosphaerae]MBB3960230.1 Fur family zinc uptake transcriptional regulator [Aureimonas phyllosphaerae]SFF35358.1 Fur family transcriptional regulator, zinc uptake regulator [Aureimonas phyllosphaerae]
MSHDHHHSHTAGAEKALTRNQKLVFDILEQADGPLSAYSILDALREEGLRAPPQVYRALEKLLETGLVHRLESLNAFVACAHPHACAHALTAFAICEKCGAVTEFADAAVEARLAGWAGERGFVPKRTTVEIKGLCAACA